MRITAPDAVTEQRTVLFDTAEFELDAVQIDDADDPNDTTILDEFAAFLLAHPTAQATVIGHTDTVDTNANNLTLSKNRANSVRDYLVNVKNVPESQLRVGWHGETDLEVSTANPEANQTNRRVELTVTFSDPPLVPAPEVPPPNKGSKTPTSKTTPGSGGGGGGTEEEGAVAVAAAFALNLPESDTSASIGGDVIIVAQGSVTVRGRANTNALALADGGAVTTEGGTTVGAAVAINSAGTDNTATVAAADITADGITVEAVMTDNQVGLTAAEPETVDVAANTIFVGQADGLATGEKVKYTAGGDTAHGRPDRLAPPLLRHQPGRRQDPARHQPGQRGGRHGD